LRADLTKATMLHDSRDRSLNLYMVSLVDGFTA